MSSHHGGNHGPPPGVGLCKPRSRMHRRGSLSLSSGARFTFHVWYATSDARSEENTEQIGPLPWRGGIRKIVNRSSWPGARGRVWFGVLSALGSHRSTASGSRRKPPPPGAARDRRAFGYRLSTNPPLRATYSPSTGGMRTTMVRGRPRFLFWRSSRPGGPPARVGATTPPHVRSAGTILHGPSRSSVQLLLASLRRVGEAGGPLREPPIFLAPRGEKGGGLRAAPGALLLDEGGLQTAITKGVWSIHRGGPAQRGRWRPIPRLGPLRQSAASRICRARLMFCAPLCLRPLSIAVSVWRVPLHRVTLCFVSVVHRRSPRQSRRQTMKHSDAVRIALRSSRAHAGYSIPRSSPGATTAGQWPPGPGAGLTLQRFFRSPRRQFTRCCLRSRRPDWISAGPAWRAVSNVDSSGAAGQPALVSIPPTIKKTVINFSATEGVTSPFAADRQSPVRIFSNHNRGESHEASATRRRLDGPHVGQACLGRTLSVGQFCLGQEGSRGALDTQDLARIGRAQTRPSPGHRCAPWSPRHRCRQSGWAKAQQSNDRLRDLHQGPTGRGSAV